ncbi:Postreplication repair E3 ubiquitin- ligase rad18 [Lecanosticta acicola]|uniref:Postreplication repair E3 ubiquitin-protein ligase RAD18 n=1 Tax=Lecanosticta acicola TaxID=111012 RepID=A0AAI8YVW4_9PEZI|nr:Postreplication repair E3 ubiquitin- ligase rad18 [Lecanosticta acicola]
MDAAYDVPDSTDWLHTPLKDFASLENALHCQICKEFYDTPMITTCNHTFCSKCIRTSLSADGKCPACRTADQASKLRSNWALQEVVSNFLAARPAALVLARKAQEETDTLKRPGKRKRATVPNSSDAADESSSGRTLRSKSRRIAASQESQPEPIEIEDSEPEDDEEPELDDGRVACPLGCGKRMKEEEVFNHLDRCEDEKKQASKGKSRPPLNGFAKSKPPSSQTARPQDRTNELNYSMMKETALAKKLKEIGVPNWGSKQLMISRHKEWVNIWNANCDSTRPRTKRELLHDLDTWERTQGGRAPVANGFSSTIMRKDFDQGAYAKRHQDDFSRLIADARRKKNNPAVENKQSQEDDDHESMKPETEEGNDKSSFFINADGVTGRRPSNGYSPPSLKHSDSGDPKPYEDNPEAISSIRRKVEAINRGEQITPVVNRGFEIPSAGIESRGSPPSDTKDFARSPQEESHEPPSMFNERIMPAQESFPSQRRSESTRVAGSASPGDAKATLRRGSSRDEHLAHENTGSPCDLPSHLLDDTKKVPMFAVPSQPVRDIDGGEGSGTP